MVTRMKSELDRREFLKQMGWIAAAGAPVLLSAAGCAPSLQTYRVVPHNGTITLSLSTYPELQTVGGGISLSVPQGEDPILLVRSGNESFAALSPVCMHLGCTVRKESMFFRCPCHGSTYTLEGEVVRGPAQRSLQRYPVLVSEDTIMIQIAK